MRKETSTLLFYQPSTTDHCHSINQYMEHISLHPIDCLYENFRQYLKTVEDFMPQDLESRDLEKYSKAVQVLQKFFEDVVEVSNANIIRNANNLLMTLPPNSDKNIS